MTRRAAPPPIDTVPRGCGLRQRQRKDGTWRVWWDPTAEERARGAAPEDLDETRPTQSVRRAQELKRKWSRTRADQSLRTDAGGRTVAALIAKYRKSQKFLNRKPATRSGYEADFKVIDGKWGRQGVAGFDKSVMFTWYETLHAQGPSYARKLLASFSVLMTYAELIGWRAPNSNPCSRLGMEQAPRRKRFATWAEYDALLAAAQVLGWPDMATGIALGMLSGQRQTDIVDARIADFRMAPDPRDVTGASQLLVWQLQRSKRGNLGLIAVHPDAAALVQARIDAAAPGQTHLLRRDASGAALSLDLFRQRWALVRARAAKRPTQDELAAHLSGRAVLPDAALTAVPSLLNPALQFRDLRRTFGVLGRANMVSREDLADVLGNGAGLDPILGEVYMPSQFGTTVRTVMSIERPKEAEQKAAR